MKYTDRIYGEVDITENVVVDIINSQAFQRLRGIDQAGYFEVHFPGTKHSRLEHSIGCYLLLKRYGASLEEQLAGLIHDVSHSAFSHTADYVFAEGRAADQNYQDDIFVDFIRKTDIVKILERYDYDVDVILNEDNFPLQETQLPNLCADRIDYSLRGAIVYGVVTEEKIKEMLKSLKVIDDKWVFSSFDIALQYAQMFQKLNEVYYSNKETAAMFLRTSKWIKYAFAKKYITHQDLFTTDDQVISKINTFLNNDEELRNLWTKMNSSDIKCAYSDVGDADGEKVVVKSRVVDPLCISASKIQQVSSLNEQWRVFLQENMKPKTYYIQ